MFCSQCGFEQPEGNRFCQSCGKSLSGIGQMAGQGQPSMSQGMVMNQPPVQARTPKPRKWGCLVISIVVLVILGVGLYYFVKNMQIIIGVLVMAAIFLFSANRGGNRHMDLDVDSSPNDDGGNDDGGGGSDD